MAKIHTQVTLTQWLARCWLRNSVRVHERVEGLMDRCDDVAGRVVFYS